MKLFITAAVFSVLAGTAFASTPDGETPAEETFCDDQSGAAFGICNAYCEAMDCGDPDQHANDRACEQKEAQYERITGQPMPTCGAAPPPVPCEDECEIRYSYALAGCTVSERIESDDSSLRTSEPTCEEAAAAYFEECLDQCAEDECVPLGAGVCDLPEKRIDSTVSDSCACEELGGVWLTDERR